MLKFLQTSRYWYHEVEPISSSSTDKLGSIGPDWLSAAVVDNLLQQVPLC